MLATLASEIMQLRVFLLSEAALECQGWPPGSFETSVVSSEQFQAILAAPDVCLAAISGRRSILPSLMGSAPDLPYQI